MPLFPTVFHCLYPRSLRVGIPCLRVSVLIFIVVLLLIGAASRGAAQVGLQLEAGLDGKIRAGRWVPVRVTATNSGQPLTGQVELAIPEARTTVPLELPTTARKQIEATVLSQTPLSYFQPTSARATATLRVENRDVAATQIQVQELPEGARLLVVCGEAAGGLRFLDGVPLGEAGWSLPLREQGRSQQDLTITAHPLPSTMPVDWTGLDAADLLVVRDAAWGQLEPEQRRAVRRWVEMGGRLLMCGEDPAGFRDEEGQRVLPVRRAIPRPRTALTAFPLPDREPIRAAAGQVMTLAARPLPSAIVGLNEAGAPILVTRPTGFGAVTWLGFDPFRVPPPRETSRRALWAFLIGRASGAQVQGPAFPALSDVPAATGPVRTLPHFPAPSRWTLSAFGMVYVAVFGPVNIWLLRRLRRTVRAWLLMPLLSIGMTGGVLAAGTTWSRARAVFHAVSVREAMAGTGTAREITYAALFSPTSRPYGLEIDDPTPAVRFMDGEGDDASVNASPAGYRPPPNALSVPDIRDGEVSRWDQLPLALYMIQSIQIERAADLGGGVDMDLDDRLTGRVTNQTGYRLQAAYLQFHGWRYVIGDLGPGVRCAVGTPGWKRRRMLEQAAGGGGRSHESGATGDVAPVGGRWPSDNRPLTSQSAGSGGDDLLTMAGSMLQGGAERAEVLLVARIPSLEPPVRVPGIRRTPAPGLPAGAILVVRKPVGVPSGFAPGPLASLGGTP